MKPSRSIHRARLFAPLVATISLALAAPTAFAANYYWDTDGATPGAGGATPSGTWGNTFWSTDSTGSTANGTHTTATADALFFSAGTDATGTYTITLSGNQAANSLNFEEGAVLLTAGSASTVTIGTGTAVLVATGSSVTVGSNITISRAATFTLGGVGATPGSAPGGDIIIDSGGTVSVTSNNSLVINGVGTNVTVKTDGTLKNTTGSTGSLTLGQGTESNNSLTVSGGTVTWQGKNGTSAFGMLLGNSSGATGTVMMTSGSITTSTAGALVGFGNNASSTGNVFNLNGGILTTDGIAVSNGTGAFNFGGGTIKSNTGFTWASNPNMTATVKDGGLTFDTNGNTASIAQDLLHGSGATTDNLTKIGAGTLTLSGNNSYTGVSAINVGILTISSNTALGSTAGNTTIAATGSSTTGGQLKISSGITSAENITITGISEALSSNAAILGVGTGSILSGDITLSSLTGGIRIGATSGASLTLSGNISQTGTSNTLNLQAQGVGSSIIVNNAIGNNGGDLNIYGTVSTGTGTVTLGGVSGTGIGNTNISLTGTLKLGVTDALSTTANLTLGAVSTTAGSDFGTFDLAGYNQSVNALIGQRNTSNDGATTTRIVTNSAASGTNTLTVGNGDGSGNFDGVIVDGLNAKVALTKTGAGTETLSGPNTFSGSTTITSGTLTLGANDVLPDASPVSIGAATLNADTTGTEIAGTLAATAAATINLGTGAKLEFADSSGIDWTGGTLNITGDFVSGTSIKFGSSAGGLTGDQKLLISVNGIGAGTYTLDTGGYLVSAGGSNYASWANDPLKGNIPGEPATGDFDNDGITNIVEYALGMNPRVSSQPAGDLSGNTITYTKGADAIANGDVSWVIETSQTLAGGSWIPQVTQPAGDTNLTISYSFTLGTPEKNFAHLKVTQTP